MMFVIVAALVGNTRHKKSGTAKLFLMLCLGEYFLAKDGGYRGAADVVVGSMLHAS